MKHYDTTKRVHRIGQPGILTTNRNYEFTLEDSTKDLLREGARREGMPNYSNASSEQLRNFLQGRDVNKILFKLYKRSQ
jgi:hypothetical protein